MSKELIHLVTVLCTVIEEGSFSNAAERLGVNPPAVSKAIAKLESVIGKKVLKRTTRKIEPTDVGDMLFKDGRNQLLAWEELIERAASYNSQIKGHLTVTCTPLVGESLLVPNLMAFKNKYPALNLELIFSNDVIKLPSRNIDIALRSSHTLENSSLLTKKLLVAKRLVVASPVYLRQFAPFNHPTNLSKISTLNFTHRKPFLEWEYSKEGKSGIVKCEPSIQCNSYAALKQLCVNGYGVARLSDYQVREELQNNVLVEVLPQYNWGQQTIHAVYHERMETSRKVRAFIEFLTSRIA